MITELRSPEDIEYLTLQYGFLPFFKCGIDGFSIEELTPKYLWFSDTEDGPWEWKGPVILMGSVAYGKFFRGKSGYISLKWLPDFINYRRHCYKLLANSAEKIIYDTLVDYESLLSSELKKICGYVTTYKNVGTRIEKAYLKSNKINNIGSSLKSKFDALISKLQMGTYVVIADFEYNYTKQGEKYGWGKARYTTPELMYSSILLPDCSPLESFNRMVNHLQSIFPDASLKSIQDLIK